MMEEERKESDDEQCTCGHFLTVKETTADTRMQASTSIGRKGLPTAKPGIMESSFVHLPVHFYQHVEDATLARKAPTVGSSYASSSNFLETYQHLQEMIRASQSGGDGVLLCADCISRYVTRIFQSCRV